MPKHKDRFHFEDPRDSQNEVTIYPTQGGGLYVAVAEERAVDSYNETFNCTIVLTDAEAKRLRDLLNGWFPS